MTLTYVETLTGLTGEMLLSALLDAGLPQAGLESALARCVPHPVTLSVERVARHGAPATRVHIHATEALNPSHLPDVLALLDQSGVSPRVKDRATRIWTRLIEAEARGRDEEIDLMDVRTVGGVRAMVDIVGVCEGLERLQVDRVYSVPLPLGPGLIASSPAVADLAVDARVRSDVTAGRVTAVGVAILTSIVDAFASPPSFTLRQVGYGADEDEAGLLRVYLGTADETVETDEVLVVETNIDDMNPQFYGHVVDLLFQRGALDAYLIPITMKKGRPGTLLAALVDRQHLEAVASTILDETTSIGVRTYPAQRRKLPRRVVTVETRFGPIRIKVVWHGERVRFAPEYDDCLRAAQAANVPLSVVYDEVRTAALNVGT